MIGEVEAVLPVARLILAVPFAVAGISALADPLAARLAVREWGVPQRAVDAATAVATLGAIGTAVGLLQSASARASAAVAVGVLIGVAGLAVARMIRERPSPATVSVLLRCAALGVPAGVVLWEGWRYAGPDVLPWLARIPVAQQIALAAGAAGLVLVWRAKREEPPPETPDTQQTPEIPEQRAPSLIRPKPELTIGMATFDDFDGVYFTLQALRLYHDLDNTELLVVDNYGCGYTREFVRDWVKGTYVLADDVAGTAYAKNVVFEKASGDAVLCCDSHVLFEPGVVARLKRFHRENPDCADLLQGPLVYDDGTMVSTHFDPVWREQMWGIWATDPRGLDPAGAPFEIPMQGLGAFSCRAEAWPGFHPGFRGFGGEEGYLHEKVRRGGGRCLCLPWLRWMHRFGRPKGVPYPLTVEDKLRNYLLGHLELGLDTAPVLDHFARHLPAGTVARVAAGLIA